MKQLRIGVSRAFLSSKPIEITAGYLGEGKTEVLTKVSIEEISPSMAADPFLRLTEPEAQQLFDELYLAGFRPTLKAKEAEASKAEHVSDLRKIAFKLLNIED